LNECGDKISEHGEGNGGTNDVGRGKESRIVEELALADEPPKRDIESLARMDQGNHGSVKM
jgi:hypothetical protein